MKARIATLVGTLALAATAASAQTPAVFHLAGAAVLADPTATPQPTVSFGGHTYDSSPYSGEFRISTGPDTYSLPFLVWCVDYNHESVFNTTWDVEVSPLDGSLADTRYPSESNQYDWAAYLAGSMPLDWSTSSSDAAKSVEYQVAIWDAVSQGGFGTANPTLTNNALTDLGLASNFYTTAAPGDPTGWFLITGVNGTDNSAGAEDQEFLAFNPPGFKENITPEPTTISLMGMGLAGVLGMGFRRRKRRS